MAGNNPKFPSHQPGQFPEPRLLQKFNAQQAETAWDAPSTTFADAFDWYYNDRAGLVQGDEKVLIETTFRGLARNKIGIEGHANDEYFQQLGEQYPNVTVRTCMVLLDGQWKVTSLYVRLEADLTPDKLDNHLSQAGAYLRVGEPQSDDWLYCERE